MSLITHAKSHGGYCVAALSSNFTQRGSPSLIDKFARTRTALLAGADLVLELPFVFACSAARDFARGAVNLFARLGFVDALAFGMENPGFDVSALIEAEASPAFAEALRREMSLGASYAKAHALALEACVRGAGEFVSRPNNMLALSYMREIVSNHYTLKPLPFKREGSFSSRAVREDFRANAHMLPEFSREIVSEAQRLGRVSDESKLWPLLQGLFIRSSRGELRKVLGIDEGIEGLFMKHWREAKGLDDFIGRCVCARYTRSHIRRRLVYMLLGVGRERVGEGVPYARVLGFNGRGREVLRRGAGLPLVTRLAEVGGESGRFFAEVEFRASGLYELTLEEPDMRREMQRPVMICL